MQKIDQSDLYDYVISAGSLRFRLAKTQEELEHLKKLRYRVFYEEKGARASDESKEIEQDFDDYDEYALHVIVDDTSKSFPDNIVGTHRLLMSQFMPQDATFYTQQFYQCDDLLADHDRIVEVGRVCVDAEYRTGRVLMLMWKYTMALIKRLDITLVFGCASFADDDVSKHKHSLSYLYYHHLAPPEKNLSALAKETASINILPEKDIDQKQALEGIPTLMRGYLKLNARVSEQAVIDRQFNTVFALLYLEIKDITQQAALNRITK